MNQTKDLGAANWTPLETMLRQTGRPVSLCGSFMWMYRQKRHRVLQAHRHSPLPPARLPAPVLAAG
jgi:hypothetical protein